MTNNLRVTFDPQYATEIRARAHLYQPGDTPDDPPRGLGSVDVNNLTISSTDPEALRRLAAALLEAADLADAITAEAAE